MSTGKPASLPDSQTSDRACKRKRTAKTDADFEFTGSTKKFLRTRGTNRSKPFSGYGNSKPHPLCPPKPILRLETRFFHKGMWLYVGDIVSLIDVDGGKYFAQIRTFIVDEHDEGHVVITWLVPTTDAEEGKFEASKYVIGMEEDIPRKIECIAFQCRCPSDYYRLVDSPYAVASWSPPESV